MSEKITIQDIIELLAEKHGMTKKDAETFVKGMFELIEEALATEKYVKVKGLGTFKLTEVDSRESVNVNTGERFEIQGHTKISFTPDASMKDMINKPFAHFETVILNENTKLEDTETEIEGEEEDREESSEGTTVEKTEETVITEESSEPEVNEEVIPENAEDTEVITETAPAIPTEEEIQTDTEDESAQTEETPSAIDSTEEEEEVATETEVVEAAPQEEETTMTIADAAIKAASEGKPLSETIASQEVDTEKGQEAPVSTLKEEKIEEVKEEAIKEPEEKKTKSPWGIIIAIILILCVAGGIYWYLQADKKEPAPQIPVTTTTPKVESGEVVSAQPEDSVVQGNAETATPPEAPIENKADKQPQQNTSVAPAEKETLADTVEYTITGTKTNHTLQEGESLVKLAVKFYGSKKLWPYIVKHNKSIIKDADRVPIGTNLRIPELTPKK